MTDSAERSRRRFERARRRIDDATGLLDERRRRLRRRVVTRRVVTVVAGLLLLSVLLGRLGYLGDRGESSTVYDHQSLRVERIADGDTFRVLTPEGRSEPVRMIGIDTPELRNRATGQPDYWAEEAAAYLRSRIENRRVVLDVPDERPRDRYGRLLAYVYVDDAENLNLTMVREGHAYAYRPIGHRLRRQFEQAEADARARGRGLWASVTPEQMPEWLQRWLASRETS